MNKHEMLTKRRFGLMITVRCTSLIGSERFQPRSVQLNVTPRHEFVQLGDLVIGNAVKNVSDLTRVGAVRNYPTTAHKLADQ